MLSAHGAALAAIGPRLDAVPGGGFGGAALLIPRIADDLHVLGGGRIPPPAPLHLDDLPPEEAALGLAYVVAGSRLGARLLAQRVAASTEARVRRASSYFGGAETDGLWKALVRRLDGLTLDAAGETAVIAGARAGFACFGQAFLSASRETGDVRAAAAE